MDICYRVDPLHDLFRVLFCTFDGMDFVVFASSVAFVVVDELKVYLGLV